MLFCSSSYNYRKDLKDPQLQVVNITGLGGQHHQNKNYMPIMIQNPYENVFKNEKEWKATIEKMKFTLPTRNWRRSSET
jgi:hypothetical protein